MANSVAQYYATNYTQCTNVDKSFLASWRGIRHPLIAVQLVAIPLSTLTFYCILKKSPSVMSSVKWPLFNSHLWFTFMNIIVCSLTPPYVFFPYPAGFTVGILTFLEVNIVLQTCIAAFVVTVALIYLVHLYELRSSLIEVNRFRIERRSTKLLLYSTNFCLCMLATVSLILNPTDNQEEAKLAILKKLPCPTEEFFTHPTYIAITNETITICVIVYLGGNTTLLGCQLSFFSGCCIYHLFWSPNVRISIQTRRLQRRFFIGLCLQTGVPFLFMGGATSVLYLSYIFQMTDQKLNNLVVISYSLHGVAESIVVILVHQTYREFVKKCFCGVPSITVKVESTINQRTRGYSQ